MSDFGLQSHEIFYPVPVMGHGDDDSRKWRMISRRNVEPNLVCFREIVMNEAVREV